MSDASTTLEGRKVLVVDDDEDMRLLLATMLEGKGFSVVGDSPDGSDAVLDSFEGQPDFVILDYMMPNVNGQQAASFIRATCPKAHIVAFSGAGLQDAPWADDYLEKNDIVELPELLEAVVRQRSSEAVSA